jgi:hypothetical protein
MFNPTSRSLDSANKRTEAEQCAALPDLGRDDEMRPVADARKAENDVKCKNGEQGGRLQLLLAGVTEKADALAAFLSQGVG